LCLSGRERGRGAGVVWRRVGVDCAQCEALCERCVRREAVCEALNPLLKCVFVIKMFSSLFFIFSSWSLPEQGSVRLIML
jgi:hypothetical protein